MKVALGSDHAGFALKARVARAITETGHEVVDCGADTIIPGDDYPDYAARAGAALVSGVAERGVLLCGSGVGICIAANKIAGVRACLCHDCFSARQGVEDDSMNVLCLGARVIGEELAADLVRTFLAARFSGAERHVRRARKVAEMEAGERPL